jgi:hypothetical protein
MVAAVYALVAPDQHRSDRHAKVAAETHTVRGRSVTPEGFFETINQTVEAFAAPRCRAGRCGTMSR